MSPEQQLDYVAKYLAPYKGKIGTLQDLYMAVLSPGMIGKPGNAVVFSKEKNPAEYAANAPLDVDKKGTITVSDAVNAVMRRTGGTATAQAPLPRPRFQRNPIRVCWWPASRAGTRTGDACCCCTTSPRDCRSPGP